MAIEQDLDARLKQALRDKDQATLDVVRMLKSKVQERRTAKGFSGQVDDALLLDVIASYRKQLQKAAEEFEKAGERGRASLDKLRFEIGFLSQYLPATMGEDELRALVRERIAALGVGDAKQVGRLVGDVMKTHKGKVEAADVKRVAEELLLPKT
ncbi:MAG: GatB/YqeY domain-containing protein [Thermodesulfobacteriota bacterium]